MRRPQFSLKTLLWLMAVVAAFSGGAAWQHRMASERISALQSECAALNEDVLKLQISLARSDARIVEMTNASNER
jgi:hypothetical protein